WPTPGLPSRLGSISTPSAAARTCAFPSRVRRATSRRRCAVSEPGWPDLSDPTTSVECTFDMDESALVEEISRLERMKSAAAAGQARAAAALDQLRRANEGAAGVALGQAGLWRGQRGGVGAPRFTGAGRPPSRIR